MARILLVDDEASVRSALRKLLERGGFDLREAGSGKAALETIATDSGIEAVVSDDPQLVVDALRLALLRRD